MLVALSYSPNSNRHCKNIFRLNEELGECQAPRQTGGTIRVRSNGECPVCNFFPTTSSLEAKRVSSSQGEEYQCSDRCCPERESDPSATESDSERHEIPQHKMGGNPKEVIRAVEVDSLNRNRDISRQEDIEVPPSLASSALLADLVRPGARSRSMEGIPRYEKVKP